MARSRLMSSVETVTILFTDLVGSTGLVSRIGPGAAEELRGEHFALIRAAIKETGGREVKNTGDGVMVAFESAAAAVACGVSVQQRLERRNRKRDEQLLIKVGLSVGDATAAEGDYFGMPVIEAARLCDRAQGGQILAKEIVAHLMGAREAQAFKPVGEFEVKGLPEPLAIVEVAWEPLGREGASLPLPLRLQEMTPGGFVGRVEERKRLAQLLDAVGEGHRQVALISGEPGIGKTRLATYTASEARSDGAIVLYGRADADLAIPYGPWIDALRHYVEHAPESGLRDHVGRHGGELTRLLPELDERIPDVPRPRETDPDTERYLLWGAVLGLLREASSEEPLVLILDDLHWADKPTLQLLKHITSQGHEVRTLTIGTYRESDIARGHPLLEILAELRQEQGVERIALKGLDEHDVVQIMEQAAGHELDEAGRDLAKELFRETDGNPFYTGELLRHLLESGGVYQQESGRWTVRDDLSKLELPESVREVVGRRIERLGEEARKALSIAAVIGREFNVDLLLRISDQSEDELLELLEEAVSASVLTESASAPGGFSFAHALINHTLYEDLGATRRARIHRRVADALEDQLGAEPGPRVSELAHHWVKATTAIDLPKAISYARQAGERALAELAPDEALRWFSQALELQDQQPSVDPVERCDLLIGLGEAQRQAGEPAFRETLLEGASVASDLGDADRAARAALANNRGMQSSFGKVDEARMAALDRALDLDRFTNPARCARLLSLQALELQFDPDHERRRGLVHKALALAREAGDARALAHVLRDSALALWAPDTLSLLGVVVEELNATAQEVQDPALEFWATDIGGQVKAERGELEQGEAQLEQACDLADALGQPVLRWFGLYASACVSFLRGDLREAERLAEEALRAGNDAGEPDALIIYGSQLALVRHMQGRGAEIVELLEQGLELNPGISAWRAGLADVYSWIGREAEGAAIAEAAAADGFAHVPWDQIRLTTLALYAEAATLGGVGHAAAPLYELLEPWAEQIVYNGASAYGHVRTYLGMLAATLGWDERADEHFALACEIQEQKGMLLWAARGHLGWAEALAGRGETERAQAEATRALEHSREHGYGGIERRAAAVLETSSAVQR
jgi:class 3 adenylate cyclase/tetratricopeptide (TPR) repeat protein